MKYYTRHVKKYLPGDLIFAENSACDGMYIIDSGKVRIFKTIYIDGRAKEIELCQLGAKAMFGEMAMIDEDKRSATVQAIEATACTVITKSIFDDQLSKIPPWMVNMIKILVSRLRDTNEKMRSIIEENDVMNREESVEAIDREGIEGVTSTTELINDGKTPKSQSDEIIESLFDEKIE